MDIDACSMFMAWLLKNSFRPCFPFGLCEILFEFWGELHVLATQHSSNTLAQLNARDAGDFSSVQGKR